MNTHAHDLRRGDCVGRAKLRLLDKPLEFIHEDHLREREICATLDRIVDAEDPGRNEVSEVLGFLRKVLPLHLEDEEEDLFPLLRRRCELEDEIHRAIERLTADHRRASKDTPNVVAILELLASGRGRLSDTERSTLGRYATHARRHLILENAIILPFAKLRLSEHDLETLRLRMMKRRGLDQLMEPPDAEGPS